MIRAYCTVCQDSIVHSNGQEQQEVATGPCGHVFHQDCLTRWIKQKTTCPKCRQKVNKPIVLFLDEEENLNKTISEDDTVSLRNNLENLKRLIRDKDEERTQLSSEKIEIQNSLDSLKRKYSSVEKKLSSELSINAALKKQLMFLKKQEMEVAEAEKEAMSCKQELRQYQRIKTLVEGNKVEANEMLHGLREETGTFSEMVTQLIILKKELEKIRESRNRARENKEKYEREINKLKYELSAKEVEMKKTNEQLSLTESDLTRIEKENASLRKKMSKLEQAFNSPSPRSSAITRLMLESPAPLELKRPRLTPPDEDCENDSTTENNYLKPHASASLNQETELEQDAREMGLHLVKTTTFHSNLLKSSIHRPPLKVVQPRKRPAEDFDSGSSVIKKGYDGLGGHAKFLKPSKLTKGPTRKVSRPSTMSKFIKTTKDGKEPPLPVMTLDFN